MQVSFHLINAYQDPIKNPLLLARTVTGPLLGPGATLCTSPGEILTGYKARSFLNVRRLYTESSVLGHAAIRSEGAGLFVRQNGVGSLKAGR